MSIIYMYSVLNTLFDSYVANGASGKGYFLPEFLECLGPSAASSPPRVRMVKVPYIHELTRPHAGSKTYCGIA